MSEAARLTGAQLSELLQLISGADSVELKLTIPDAERFATLKALDVDPLDAEIRQVVFFDTPDLALYNAGLVVRSRRVQNGADDSTVKLRPVVPADLPDTLRRTADFVVEVDAMPGGFVCSGSYKGRLRQGELKAVMNGEGTIRKLFTKPQRAFFKQYAPEGLDLDDLTLLGPITVFKLKFEPDGFDRRMVAEMWLYPDGSRILELSTKCAPNEAFQVSAEARAFLADRGVDAGGEQQTKTRTALEFFTSGK
jgi:hypothetical protein